MPKVSRSEWEWVGAVGLIMLAVFSLPYFLGITSSTPQSRFSGFLFALEDMYSYLAKMHYGARDGWELQLVYTSEPHSGGLVQLPFLALGKLTGWLTGQGAHVNTDALIISFHIARIAAGALLMLVTYRFVAEYLVETWQRRLAWAVAMFGGGLGWAEILLASALHRNVGTPVEFYVPEAFSTLLLFGLPHLALARSCLFGGWLAYFAAVKGNDRRLALLAGLIWLVMGLCVPFHIALLGVLMAVSLAATALVEKRYPARETWLAAVSGFMPLLYLGYCAWLFTANPVFAAWSRQNDLPSPSPTEYLLAYGVLIALGVPGVVQVVKSQLNQKTILLTVWPVVGLVLAYMPVTVQRRLLEGVITCLATLATIGIASWVAVNGRVHPSRQLGLATALALLMPSSLVLIAGSMLAATQHAPEIYHAADELAALDWLAEHAPSDSVVLSTHLSGMMLPAYAPVRTFVGHGPETIDSATKTILANRFFGVGMADRDRLILIHAYAIKYVWYGDAEARLSCTNPSCFDAHRIGLAKVFQSGAYAIFEVPP